MRKFGALLLTGILAAAPSFGQAPSSFRLKVVVSEYEGQARISSIPFTFRVAPNIKASLQQMRDAREAPPSNASATCRDRAAVLPQQVGTEVAGTIVPGEGGEFRVELRITHRAWVDCRIVGTAEIPVFSNRIVDRTLTLKVGETVNLGGPAVPAATRGEEIEVTLEPVAP